jgi:hypothetical protein
MIRSEKIIWLFFAATSCQLALQHPSFLLLAGESPREEFLKDYQIKYSGATKAQFARTVRKIVSADNMILTFLVGLGFPFTLTYLVALGILLARLAGMAFKPPPGLFFHPLVLLFPLATALVHFQLFDGLLFPQNCWFFHLLLGLIPARRLSPAPGGNPGLEKFKLRPNTPIE